MSARSQRGQPQQTQITPHFILSHANKLFTAGASLLSLAIPEPMPRTIIAFDDDDSDAYVRPDRCIVGVALDAIGYSR